MTCFPSYGEHAVRELKKADGQIKSRALFPGFYEISDVTAEKDFLRELIKNPPVFVRHIAPVNEEFYISGEEADLGLILDSAKRISGLAKGSEFSVQCRIVGGNVSYKAKDVEVYVGSYFDRETGAVPRFSDYGIGGIGADVGVISVFISRGKCYAGFSKAYENLSANPDEYRIMSRSGRKISRAENKLSEAVSEFGLNFRKGGAALDLGASPGGWTGVLSGLGLRVFAVDPGDLDEKLLSDVNIIHFRSKIEDIRDEEFKSLKFDVITNDMNVDPQITAEILCSLSDRLSEDGVVVATLKLPFMDIWRSIDESTEILSRKYKILRIKNLSHNRREVTVLLKI